MSFLSDNYGANFQLHCAIISWDIVDFVFSQDLFTLYIIIFWISSGMLPKNQMNIKQVGYFFCVWIYVVSVGHLVPRHHVPGQVDEVKVTIAWSIWSPKRGDRWDSIDVWKKNIDILSPVCFVRWSYNIA